MAITLRDMEPNRYSLGIRRASVLRSTTNPAWAQTQHSIELMNCAFSLYYRATENISRAPNERLQARMTEVLEDAATDGFGFGVHDLDCAFQHLVKWQGSWFDGHSSDYTPSRSSLFRYAATSATSCVNFLEAMEDVASSVLANAEDLQQRMDRLDHAIRANRWDNVSDIMTGINVAFQGLDLLADVGLMTTVLTPGVRGVIAPEEPIPSPAEVLDAIATGLRNYENLRARGIDPRSSQGIGVLSAVVALVPVFGWYFEKALEYMPFMVDIVQGAIRRREALLQSIDREMDRSPTRGITPRAAAH